MKYTLHQNVFAGSPLDREGHLRGDTALMEKYLAAPETRFACFWRLKPLVEEGRSMPVRWAGQDVAQPLIAQGALWVFLGVVNNTPHFALDISSLDDPTALPAFAGCTLPDMRMMAGAFLPPEASILAQGRALIDWHRRHMFCAVCGKPSEVRQAGTSRKCSDEKCGAEHFPRTDPVVIMLAVRGDNCLLGRQGMFPKGFYSALAGFMEPGESIEEAVRREVDEEAGIRVGDVHYVGSQPWPFPASLMIGCICDAETSDIEIKDSELEEARWFPKELVRDTLKGARGGPLMVPPAYAIAHQLMRAWALDS